MFVLGKRFQPSLMFVGKDMILLLSGATERYFTQKGYGLTKFARDKHSSLLRKFVNYGRKTFYNIYPSSNNSQVASDRTHKALFSS